MRLVLSLLLVLVYLTSSSQYYALRFLELSPGHLLLLDSPASGLMDSRKRVRIAVVVGFVARVAREGPLVDI